MITLESPVATDTLPIRFEVLMENERKIEFDSDVDNAHTKLNYCFMFLTGAVIGLIGGQMMSSIPMQLERGFPLIGLTISGLYLNILSEKISVLLDMYYAMINSMQEDLSTYNENALLSQANNIRLTIDKALVTSLLLGLNAGIITSTALPPHLRLS